MFITGKVDINGKVEHGRLLTPERKAPELKEKQVSVCYSIADNLYNKCLMPVFAVFNILFVHGDCFKISF